MSIDTTNNINVNNSVDKTSLSAKERIQHNWNNHKVKVISSGVSTMALAGGIVAASTLGGPIGLIIGLAAATLLALGAFLISILAQPKNVKPLELPAEKSAEITETSSAEVVEKVVASEAEVVQQAVTVEKQVETAPIETKEEEKQAETALVQSEPAIEEETQKLTPAQTPTSFVKTHKLALGLGAAFIATGVAGYGIYTYAPVISAFAADAALKASEAASATAQTVANVASQAGETVQTFASSSAQTVANVASQASDKVRAFANHSAQTIEAFSYLLKAPQYF